MALSVDGLIFHGKCGWFSPVGSSHARFGRLLGEKIPISPLGWLTIERIGCEMLGSRRASSNVMQILDFHDLQCSPIFFSFFYHLIL
jgi:hypothetical protein